MSDLSEPSITEIEDFLAEDARNRFRRAVTIFAMTVGLVVLLMFFLTWLFSQEPEFFDVEVEARAALPQGVDELITGYATTTAVIKVAETLLDKPGGFIHNDQTPPGVYLDNITSWEFGALVQIRDLVKAIRNDLARSQTQSNEDPDLVAAEYEFAIGEDDWMFPRAEAEYRKGIGFMESYRARLANPDEEQSQFYARADNLRAWLEVVEKRLGGLSQRLSASVGQQRVNIDLGGDASAQQSTAASVEATVKTPWHEIDDVFFEARGTTWALVHFLKAVRLDFRAVLENKNAVVSLEQIIRELEASQEPILSPWYIPNGSGFGIFANYSLVMTSYISRANAAVIDLRVLLEQG